MRVEDAAALLGISRGLAYELVNRGELPALRLGRRIVVPTSALEELVASAGKAVPGKATSSNGKREQVDDNRSRSSRDVVRP
jgi:excisionase family DNA binding protein